MSTVKIADKPTLDNIKDAVINSSTGDSKVDECLTKLDMVINGAGSGGGVIC